LTYGIVAKNASQKIPEFPINGRFVLQPHTWYTCPPGKKAIVKGSFDCTGTGAGAEGRLLVAGVIIHRWAVSIAAAANFSIPRNSGKIIPTSGALSNPPVGIIQEINVELAAGETIVTDQDVGTNAEFNGFLRVQESPV